MHTLAQAVSLPDLPSPLHLVNEITRSLSQSPFHSSGVAGPGLCWPFLGSFKDLTPYTVTGNPHLLTSWMRPYPFPLLHYKPFKGRGCILPIA